MQATADGEFYPEQDLDKNYRIPRRPVSQPAGKNINNSASLASNAQYNAAQTPLANSYYNYPYDPSAASSYYQNYSQYYQQYGEGSSAANFSNPPPPPPPPGMEPIKRNIYNALKDIKEKPKNYNTNYFQHTVPDLQDETLPKDLKLLFQPLFCKLCSAQLSSNQTAKLHYKSKNHEKQIKKWLIAYSEKTGEPLPKRAKISTEKQQEDADKNPTWFYCEVCDLELTGKLHAESHYMGRSHQKAAMGWKAPAGQGHYDDTGKWVRIKGQKSKVFDFENGEDNFGIGFKNNEAAGTTDGSPAPKKKKEAQPAQKFHCDVCDVNTTCQEQLENHYRGQKHMKKLKQQGLAKYTEQRDLIEQTGQPSYPPSSTPSIVESPQPVSDKDLNLSVYRTPSGDYYCPICNITMNSEAQFVQHMKSKNHAKKAAQKKSGNN